MKRLFRPFRSRSTRLLAGLLVAAALLLNGMTAAMAAPVSMDSDCCAGMDGQHGQKSPCHDAGNPCPASGTDCDEQCLARCMGSTVFPSHAISLPEFFQRHAAQSGLIARASSSPPPDPGLRPPISA